MTSEKSFIVIVFDINQTFSWIFQFIRQLDKIASSQWTVHRNIHIFAIYRFDYPARSFINSDINSVQNFLKAFVKTKLRINHCFSYRIRLNRRIFI